VSFFDIILLHITVTFIHFSAFLQRVGLDNLREEEENNLPQMKKLFFLYVWLNLTRIAELRKEDLVKEIK